MSFSATRTGELLGAIAAACERLVHRSVAGAERGPQRRLIGLMLAAPLPLGAAIAVVMTPQIGAPGALSAIGLCLAVALSGALAVAATGRGTVPAAAGLAAAMLALAMLVAAAGGPASPLLLLAAALPFEAWWQARRPGAALWGLIAALAVVPLQTLFAGAFPHAAPHAAQWLLPLAYAALAAPRVAALWDEAAGQAAPRLEDRIDAIVLRLSDIGEVNDAAGRARPLLGVAPELLLFDGFFERIHVGDRVAWLAALADLRRGAAERRVELRLRAAGEGQGGGSRVFAVELHGAAGGDGDVVAVVRGGDEAVALRAELAAAREAAGGSEVAKSRFLAAVSHELRTPLNAIIGFSDMLLHEMFGPFRDRRQKDYVALVRESGQHLLSVVNSILDVSRIEAGAYRPAPEPFRFREAVEMCQAMLAQQAAGKGLDLAAHVPAEIGEVIADRRAVQQILINLISNAVKFTPDGGQVRIGARRIGSRLHFWVADSGIGMSADELDRVGTPFTQVHNDYTRRYEGAGLGLSLVKGLVASHEGTLSIESEPGGGTTVTVSLPVDGPAAGSASVVRMPTAKGKEDGDGQIRKTA